tara:strand:- start:540 stop:1544 length:1005 start_codon:yes stop_codon:yes gene_type:complete
MKTSLKTSKIGKTDLEVTQIGMGGAPLGRSNISTSFETLETAFKKGITYFDTAPHYGAGESEKFYGNFLSTIDRSSFTLSSKVGRLILSKEEASKYEYNGPLTPTIKNNIKASKYPNNVVFNFSKDGILRSIEESLERLKLDYIDILLIHDPDDYYEQALNETYPVLADLKSQGIIKAIGAGMNEWEMLAKFANEADFDCFLVAGRYTLLDHSALHTLMPICAEKDISLIMGGPYNSGILASDLTSETTYFYEQSPKEIVDRAKSIKMICDQFNVPMKAAALQFGLNHPVVATTVPGPTSPEEVAENIEMANFEIPSNLWEALKTEKLIDENCP